MQELLLRMALHEWLSLDFILACGHASFDSGREAARHMEEMPGYSSQSLAPTQACTHTELWGGNTSELVDVHTYTDHKRTRTNVFVLFCLPTALTHSHSFFCYSFFILFCSQKCKKRRENLPLLKFSFVKPLHIFDS